MRSLILVAMAFCALSCGEALSEDAEQPEALFKSCPKGVLFRELRSGIVVTAVRQGHGKAVFTENKHRLQAATAAEFLTKEGEHGFIYGPMRSYMFAVDADVLKDFEWRPAQTALHAFYTVRTDDGTEALFTLHDTGCAP